MSMIYCYGITEEKIQLDMKGFKEQKVYVISFKDINAVVSDVSEEDFSQEVIDKNVKDMKWLADNGLMHEAVIDAVMKKTTIMPMKFCTIFKAKENVLAMLEERYADFRFNLKSLRCKVEMGVKVYFDAEPLKEKIKQESEEIKRIEEEAKKKKPGAAYFDRQKIGILLKEKVRQKISKDEKEIFDRIKILAQDSKQNELIGKKLIEKDMLLNAVFLINRENTENFKSSIKKIEPSYPDMKFEVWGPFPPYNFIKPQKIPEEFLSIK